MYHTVGNRVQYLIQWDFKKIMLNNFQPHQPEKEEKNANSFNSH